MNNNTILFLNHLIYAIYNIEDFESLKVHILESLKSVIPFECGSISMAEQGDSERMLGDYAVVPERYSAVEEKYRLIERHDISRWQMQTQQAGIFRASDLLDEEQWERTVLYRECYQPFGLYHGVDMTIVQTGRFLGILTLYRQKAQGDFSEDELFLLKLISDHLNARFHRETVAGHSRMSPQLAKVVRSYGLTARETEIASMVMAGSSNEEISRELAISANTLKKHLQHIYRKTGVTGRVELSVLSAQ